MILDLICNGTAPAPDVQWTSQASIAFGSVRWYSIFIITGFVIAIVGSCMKMWKRYKISVEPFYWFILIGVPISLLGANFGSCVLDSFWRIDGCPGGMSPGKPWDQFWTSFGTGLAIEWGVLFCFIAGCIYFPLVLRANRYKIRDEFGPKPQVRKVSCWLYLDAIMPCVLIAQCIGRWGNYFNQEVYGAIVTNERLSWFLHDCLPYMYKDGNYYQPLFLWEMLLNLCGFLLLYVGAEFLKVRKTGDISAAYYIWYGVVRLCLEPLRDQQFKSNASMVMSGIYVIFGVLFIAINHLFVARCRDKKALKLWFSIYLMKFFKTYFMRKTFKKHVLLIEINNNWSEEKITRAQNKNKKLINKNTKIDEKNKKILEKHIEFQKSIILKTNNKLNKIQSCKQEYINNASKKIESLKKQKPTEKILNQIKSIEWKLSKKQESYTNKINLWEKRLDNVQAALKDVQSSQIAWKFSNDYYRSEQEKLYFGRW